MRALKEYKMRHKANYLWRLSGNELTIDASCWPLKLVTGSAFFLAGCMCLYFKVIKRFQATNVDYHLDAGLIFPGIISSVLLLIGYAIIFGIDLTYFDLLKRTYLRRYGVFPFIRASSGHMDEVLAEVRLEPLDESRLLPGEESWELSLIWKDGPLGEQERSQNISSAAGRLENGRNTAAVELERNGQELAQLLQVPLRVQRAWWESTTPKQTDAQAPALPARIDLAPLLDMGYSSPLLYRFRRKNESRASIEPCGGLLWIFLALSILCGAAALVGLILSWPNDIWFFAVFGFAVSLISTVVAWCIRSHSPILLDVTAKQIQIDRGRRIIDLSRIGAVQICYAGRTPLFSDETGTYGGKDIFQLVLVEKGDPPLRHGLLAGEPFKAVERIARGVATFLKVQVISSLERS